MRLACLLFLSIMTLLKADDASRAAALEGDPSSLIEGKISAVTGDLVIVKKYLEVKGAEPIVLYKHYCSSDHKEVFHGWSLNAGSMLYAVQSVHDSNLDKDYPGMGYFDPRFHIPLTFLLKNIPNPGETKSLELTPACYNMPANTSKGEPSGRTNVRNYKMTYYRGQKRSENIFTVYTPDGATQIFKPDPSSDWYLLEKEVKPNGNILHYEWGTKNQTLKKIYSTDPTGTIVFAWVRFSSEKKKDGIALTITTSDEETEKIEFLSAKMTVDGQKQTCYRLGYQGAHYMPEERYGYEEDKKVSKIIGADWRLEKIDYKKGRVEQVKKNYEKDKPLPYMKIQYPKKGKYKKEGGQTEVRYPDSLHRYWFDEYYRLDIIDYKSLDDKKRYKRECFFWGNSNTRDRSCLMVRTLDDENSNHLHAIQNSYDGQGNITKKTFWGNLSGKGVPLGPLHQDGTPENPQVESYSTHFSYNSDNLPTRIEEDNGKVILITYHANSDLMATRQILDKETPLITETFSYKWGRLIEKITSSATHQFIERINLRDHGSFIGLPEEECQYAYNFSTGEEELIEREVLHYDSRGFVVKRDHYDADNSLAYSLEFTYDARGRLSSKTNPLGQKATYSYDNNFNRVIKKPFSNTHVQHRYYDLANRLRATRHRGEYDLVNFFNYDLRGFLIEEKDPFGKTTSYSNDPFGKPLTTKLPSIPNLTSGAESIPLTQTTYNAYNLPATITDAEGNTKTIKYNAHKKPIQITYPDGSEESFTYTLEGLLENHTDQEGHVTSYTYDIWGNKTSITTSHTLETFTYDPFGHLLTHVDPAGTLTRFTYNAKGQKVRATHHGTKKESLTYTYDPLGRVETTTVHGENPLVTKYTYDLVGNVLSETKESLSGEELSYVAYTYDAAGNRETKSQYVQGKLALSKTTYDSLNREISHTDPLGNTTKTQYEYTDVLTKTTTNPNQVRTVETFNSHGNLETLQKFSPSGELLLQEKIYYNLNDQILHQKSLLLPDQKERLISYERDSLDRLTARIEAAHTNAPKITRYSYTPKGHEQTITKPDGTTIHKTYDALGRNDSITAPDIHYTFTYDNLGNLIASTDHIQNMTFSRILDSKGRLLSESLPFGQTITHTYNRSGQKTSTTLPKGTLYFSYNPLHLTSVTYNNLTHTYTYDTSGNLTSETLPYSLGRVTRTYDLNQNVLSLQTPYGTEQNTQFDPAGNLLQTTWQTSHLNATVDYTYNDLDELLSETGPIPHTYTYDSHYNRTSIDETPYLLNDLNQLISHHTYDQNGNPLTHKNCRLTYDALDRLIKVETPTSIYHYTYDGINRRISRNNVPFLYDDKLEIGTPNNIRILGLTPHAEISSAILYDLNGSYYIPIHDTFGNPIALLTPWGNIQEAIYYSSYGEELHFNKPISPWRYSSKRLDPETSLIHFGFRHYDPSTGRFLTPDPKGFADNIPNLYTFLLNSPLLHFDEWGYLSLFGLNQTYAALEGRITMDHLQMGLGFASMIPVPYIAIPAIALNTSIDLYRGNYGSAALGVLPTGRIIGAAGKQIAKAAPLLRSTKALPKAADIAKKAKIRKAPNPYGSRGSPAHVAKIEEIRQDFLAKGYKHEAGGFEMQERVIKIPEGGYKPIRKPDLIMKAPSGKEVHVNVGRTTQKGLPVARERRAMEDLIKANEPEGYLTIFKAYYPEK